ncbi:MAG: hypothetical protein WKF96_22470 [Solirubrobacteraceae bacterium]
MNRKIVSQRVAAVLATATLATGGLAALPAGHSASGVGPSKAEAYMIPLPGWWTGKLVCMPGQPLQQAGLCGDGGNAPMA